MTFRRFLATFAALAALTTLLAATTRLSYTQALVPVTLAFILGGWAFDTARARRARRTYLIREVDADGSIIRTITARRP